MVIEIALLLGLIIIIIQTMINNTTYKFLFNWYTLLIYFFLYFAFGELININTWVISFEQLVASEHSIGIFSLSFIAFRSALKTNIKSLSTLAANYDFTTANPDKPLKPWWVTGITDSEGNFSVFTQKTSKGIKITLGYKVTQKAHSKGILHDLERFFKCGNILIDNKKEDAYKFNVNKLDDILNIIIPHFDSYPLFSSKRLDYLDFKKVALMMKEGLHLNENYLKIILSIKDKMNSKRSFEERWKFFDSIEPIKLSDEWVQAFIDGDGSFQFGIADAVSRGKSYVALTPTLSISQSSHDIKLLNAFVSFFGCGYLKPKYDINNLEQAKASRSVNSYVVNQHAIISEFVDKYPMLTPKQLDYLEGRIRRFNSSRSEYYSFDFFGLTFPPTSFRVKSWWIDSV
uniref:Homing endonuclease LAGLIDADG domain-containing protein n=1 Tax=Dactylella tenuis TaxID=383872 RepID=A0A4Y5MZS6_9PEZI|nr:hypothetical protein [Dactylella tenuis]QCW06869.1 hypothetical protein [Dactylella tenuis]